MIELISNNVAMDLPADLSLDLYYRNPFFYEEGSHSLPFSLPLTENNRRILGFTDVASVAENKEITVPVELKFNGIVYLNGRFFVDNIDLVNSIIEGNLESGTGMWSSLTKDKYLTDITFPVKIEKKDEVLYYGITESDRNARLDAFNQLLYDILADENHDEHMNDYYTFLYTNIVNDLHYQGYENQLNPLIEGIEDELDFDVRNAAFKHILYNITTRDSKFYPTINYTFFPIKYYYTHYNQETDNELNKWDKVNFKLENHFPQFFLCYILRMIYAHYGFILVENDIENDAEYSQLVILNNGIIDPLGNTLGDFLPKVLISDFLQLINFLGYYSDIDETTREVRIKKIHKTITEGESELYTNLKLTNIKHEITNGISLSYTGEEDFFKGYVKDLEYEIGGEFETYDEIAGSMFNKYYLVKSENILYQIFEPTDEILVYNEESTYKLWDIVKLDEPGIYAFAIKNKFKGIDPNLDIEAPIYWKRIKNNMVPYSFNFSKKISGKGEKTVTCKASPAIMIQNTAWQISPTISCNLKENTILCFWRGMQATPDYNPIGSSSNYMTVQNGADPEFKQIPNCTKTLGTNGDNTIFDNSWSTYDYWQQNIKKTIRAKIYFDELFFNTLNYKKKLIISQNNYLISEIRVKATQKGLETADVELVKV